jgi:hypothetical protein
LLVIFRKNLLLGITDEDIPVEVSTADWKTDDEIITMLIGDDEGLEDLLPIDIKPNNFEKYLSDFENLNNYLESESFYFDIAFILHDMNESSFSKEIKTFDDHITYFNFITYFRNFHIYRYLFNKDKDFLWFHQIFPYLFSDCCI